MEEKDESYWKNKLTPEQFRVLRQSGTEAPFSGQFAHHHENGIYACAACGQSLFASDTKFESHSGWPSFYDVARQGNVELHEDISGGMKRIEVRCANCGGHLGHLFDDGPADKTGQRYCINSAALNFKNKDNE